MEKTEDSTRRKGGAGGERAHSPATGVSRHLVTPRRWVRPVNPAIPGEGVGSLYQAFAHFYTRSFFLDGQVISHWLPESENRTSTMTPILP
jgi:hypothetical protein